MPEYYVFCKRGEPVSAENIRLARNAQPARRLNNVRGQIVSRLLPGESFVRRIGHRSEPQIGDMIDNIGQFRLDPQLLTKDGPAGHPDAAEKGTELLGKRAGCTLRDLFPEIELPPEDLRFPVNLGASLSGSPLKKSEILIPEISFLEQEAFAPQLKYVDLVLRDLHARGPFIRMSSYPYFSHFNRMVNVHSIPHGFWLRVPSAELIRTLLSDNTVQTRIMEAVKGTGIRHILCSNIYKYDNSGSVLTQDTVYSRWFVEMPLCRRHPVTHLTGMIDIEDPSKGIADDRFNTLPDPMVILEKIEY